MGDLSALESHCNSDLVTIVKKTVCVLDLGLKIVYVDTVRKADLLDLNNLLTLTCFLFLLLLIPSCSPSLPITLTCCAVISSLMSWVFLVLIPEHLRYSVIPTKKCVKDRILHTRTRGIPAFSVFDP